jgi:hypothetical protein
MAQVVAEVEQKAREYHSAVRPLSEIVAKTFVPR